MGHLGVCSECGGPVDVIIDLFDSQHISLKCRICNADTSNPVILMRPKLPTVRNQTFTVYTDTYMKGD